jgi:hypothetical protein
MVLGWMMENKPLNLFLGLGLGVARFLVSENGLAVDFDLVSVCGGSLQGG